MNWHGLLEESAIAALLPKDNAHFAKPVCDGLAVFLEGLSKSRQASILAQQASLSPSADVSERLGLLARSCPVLQKIGQVLARDQRLASKLRVHLRELESLPATVPLEEIQKILDQELGSLDRLGITLAPPALAEASVAVVIPFSKDGPSYKNGGRESQQGVFKILKPGITELLEEELGLLERVGAHLDDRCDELCIPHLDYQEAFQQVRNKLREEICLDDEQRKLVAAREFYADENRVQIPTLFDCCTPRVTAMQRVWGDKVTNHQFTKPSDKHWLADLIVETMIAKPIFAKQGRALFHSDPHAGNLFLTTDRRLAILDWSLVGWLDEQARTSIVQIMLSAVALDERRMVAVLSKMAERGRPDQSKLQLVVKGWLKKLRRGQFPGLSWLVGMLDEAVSDARLRLKPDLMLFRKSLYTLDGVVAEVGARTAAFDKVLCMKFLRHLAMEWPSRWFSLPNSREFGTRLSNFDLTQAILGLPTSATRFWMGHGLDIVDACRTNTKITS